MSGAGDPPSTSPFPIVGIGASAGGLQALGDFFAHTSPTSGMAFVIILHLSPEAESSAAALLQRHTTIPVTQVTEAVILEPNHIYVIPPAKQLEAHDGALHLVERELVQGMRVPIDAFFRSLAGAYGPWAGAVVLSGSGSDGVTGLKRIKEAAGVVCAGPAGSGIRRHVPEAPSPPAWSISCCRWPRGPRFWRRSGAARRRARSPSSPSRRRR